MSGGDGSAAGLRGAPGAVRGGNVAARPRRGHIYRFGDRMRRGTWLQACLATSLSSRKSRREPRNAPWEAEVSRMVVPLGSRCRLFSASSRHPGADSQPHPLAWRGGGFSVSRTLLAADESGRDAGRQLQRPSALSPLPGFSRREQPRGRGRLLRCPGRVPPLPAPSCASCSQGCARCCRGGGLVSLVGAWVWGSG